MFLEVDGLRLLYGQRTTRQANEITGYQQPIVRRPKQKTRTTERRKRREGSIFFCKVTMALGNVAGCRTLSIVTTLNRHQGVVKEAPGPSHRGMWLSEPLLYYTHSISRTKRRGKRQAWGQGMEGRQLTAAWLVGQQPPGVHFTTAYCVVQHHRTTQSFEVHTASSDTAHRTTGAKGLKVEALHETPAIREGK